MSFAFTAITKASKIFTASTIANTETITIGGKVYTFQTTLTDVDGNVLIGASDDAAMDNLVAAVNLAAGAGTTYAASMTANPYCSAVKSATDECQAVSLIGGTIGNLIAIAEAAGGSWAGAATALSGGTGSAAVALDEVQTELARIRADGTSSANAHILLILAQLETALEAID
jgi:hypothetical protein